MTKIYVYDVGGTYLRNAIWMGNRPTHIHKEISPSFIQYSHENINQLKDRLLKTIVAQLPSNGEHCIASISLGAALNHSTGEVYGAAPLWGPHEVNFNLLEELKNLRPNVHWILINDVTAMAMHFASQPLCNNIKRAMLITVSSGIACRIFDINPFRIDFDCSGLQGEIGHLFCGCSFSLLCDCGNANHIAAYSSGRGINNVYDYLYYKQYQKEPIYSEFEKEFKLGLENGDKFCHQVLYTSLQPLADLIASAFVLDPSIEIVALSGGVVDSLADFVKAAIVQRLITHGPYITMKNNPVKLTQMIHICPPNTANGLWGAGIVASNRNDDWIKNNIAQTGLFL